MRQIMHIDLDAFFVSVEQVLDPSLKGKPVVVGGRPGSRGVVASASYEARAFGIHSAMPLVTATRLCPSAIFIGGNFHRYREFSHRFMAILADFSPSLEPMGLDEAYLDATGFESLHGSTREMAVSIRKRVNSELGICASIGVSTCKVISKIASDYCKPDGLLVVPPGEERSFLSPLPVKRLPGVGKKGQVTLMRLGVNTIGDLARTSLARLKPHFGSWAEVMLDRANGIDPREVEAPGEAKSISRETTFDKDTRDLTALAAMLRYLSERVGNDLRGQSRQARCVSLKLRYADFTTISRQRTLAQAADTDQAIFDTGYRLLKKELASARQPVRLIGIGVSGLTGIARQLNMLDASQLRLEQLNAAIDRIRDRYGFGAIQTGRTFVLKDLYPDG